MGALMFCEVATIGECSLAHLTLEWLFSCVSELMACEGATPGECSLAHLTLKRLFSCVGALMVCEGATIGELMQPHTPHIEMAFLLCVCAYGL